MPSGVLVSPFFRRVLLVLLGLLGFIGLTLLAQAHVMPQIRQSLGAMGVWAPIGIMLLRGVSIVLPALPSTPLQIPACWMVVAGRLGVREAALAANIIRGLKSVGKTAVGRTTTKN